MARKVARRTMWTHKVVDRHTGKVVRSYTSERHAVWAAGKLCEEMHSPKRYTVEPY